MQARKDLWGYAKYNPSTPYLIDIRMAGQYFVIYVISTMKSADIKRYEPTLISNDIC